MQQTPTRDLLDFICKQELDLDQYVSLIPKIAERFDVYERKNPPSKIPAHDLLIHRVIMWEKGIQDGTLESTLDGFFFILKRDATAKQAKVVSHPEVDIGFSYSSGV